MLGKNASFFAVGIAVGALLATAVFAVLNRRADVSVTVLKLGHSLDESHPVHRALEHMNEWLERRSGGVVRLEIFPNGQLGSETECIEQVQRGALDLTKTSTAPLESFVPTMALFGVPYLFRDEAHFWSVLDGPIGREMLQAGEGVGLRGLCYYDAGARSFYTVDRPVETPGDLQGLKIRVQQSETAIKMVAALGASPTPMSLGELYTGLQQRMVDGAENNPPSFHAMRHFEVCRHYTLDEHARVPDMLIMSQRRWRQLSPAVQDWLLEAAAESSRRERELWQERTAESLRAVAEEGVAIHRPDLSLFAAQVQGMYAQYDQSPLGELIRRVRETD